MRTATARGPQNQGRLHRSIRTSAAAREHPAARLQRAIGNRSLQRLQRAANAPLEASRDASGGIEERMAEARSEGAPLEAPVRQDMEGAFGQDFSGVRVHRGPRSADLSESLNARAFTYAGDIFFNRGEFAPNTSGGRRLLAHELAHTVQQGASAATAIQREEKIKKEDIRILDVTTQITAKDVSNAVDIKVDTSKSSFDMVSSSGSSDAAFTKLVEKLALIIMSQFKGEDKKPETNFLAVLALDFSAVDWKKAGVTDAATIKKFDSGLHAFELVRWDGGQKLQLRVSYLREVTETKPTESDAKIKAGKTKFASASFSFKNPTAAQKKAGYKDWTSSEQDIVYMAVSRLPDKMASHPYVKGIDFYRKKDAGLKGRSAEYDMSTHHLEVADMTFEITKGGVTKTLSSPADLYGQSTGVAGDAASGFTSISEYTIIHEIAHAMDWGPIRKDVMAMVAGSEREDTALQKLKRIADAYKNAKDDAEKQRLVAEFNAAKGEKETAVKDVEKVLKTLSGETTLSGSTFADTGNMNVKQVNPPAQTDFEKAIAGKTPVTPYAGTNTDEAFAEGLAQYIVNPARLKEYRPELYNYFKKLLP